MSKEYLDILKISPIFQSRLRALVDELDCVRKDLAKILPISYDLLARALNLGIIPSTKSLIKLADYFDISIDYLIGLSDKELFFSAKPRTCFQERFKELRASKGITKYELGRRLNIERSLFSCWERNNYTPSLELAFQLAQFFKVSIDYLLGRTDDRS